MVEELSSTISLSIARDHHDTTQCQAVHRVYEVSALRLRPVGHPLFATASNRMEWDCCLYMLWLPTYSQLHPSLIPSVPPATDFARS